MRKSIQKTQKQLLLSASIISLMGLGMPQNVMAHVTASGVVQTNTISGVVVDANGDPIIGASVLVKGTSKGVVSDLDGRFTLKDVKEATLVISYVGYLTQEVKAQAGKNIHITLKDDNKILNEVVVVGYGTQRKEELTSSVASVKADQFIQGANTDAASMIRGKVAGLSITQSDANPLSTAQISLRGVTTLSSSTQPMVIIDGVEGNINDVSPNDIDQIDVLKDGSAAAIYGTRGTNGVILITTKRSQGEMKPTISINSYVSFQKITKRLDMLSADEYRELAASGVTGMVDAGGSTNWLDEVLQTPFNQTYNISLKGGTKNTNYVASADYTSNEGIIRRSNVNVLYPRLHITHRMWDNLLTIDAQIGGYQRSYDIPYNSNIYNYAILYNPTYSVKNEDGTWNEHGSSPLRYNPVALLEETRGENKDTKLNMFVKATLNPMEGLTISALGSRVLNNFFGGYYETQQHESTTMNGKNGYASRTTSRIQDDLFELTAQYSNRFGNHNINALAGYSWKNHNYQYAFMDNYDFPSDDYTYNNIGIGKALSLGRANQSSTQNSNRLVGWFGRLNYNFADRYFLSASVRYEGSSKFGADHKWGTFPAVSAGWTISKENFMKNVKALSLLKIRAGYGVTGTEPSSSYMSLNSISLDGYGYYKGEWINLLKPSGNPNPDLRWEKKKEFNAGLDFGFLDNRIYGSIDYYRRTTSDLIWSYSVPKPPYVSDYITANAGTIRNTGVEASLNIIPVQTKDFNWLSTINFSTNKNKLVSLSNDEFIAGSYFDTNTLIAPIQQASHRIEEGQPIGNFYGYKSVGVDDNGHWLVESANGSTISLADATAEDKKVIGNGLPKWYLSFNNTFSYKNFDLSVTMRGAFDYKILNLPKMYLGSPNALGTGNVLSSAFDKVMDGHALAYDQELAYVSYYLEDGDYWKIDNVTFGYTPNLSRLKWLKKLRLYVSISNLATITGYSGIDPEVNASGLAPGIDDLSRYPSARTYTLGINLTF